DIATFHLQSEEIAAIGKQVVAGGENWPPPPASGEVVFFGGFPGNQRLALGPKEVSFGLHCAMTPVSDFTVHQIRCRLDRRNWVDTRGLWLAIAGIRHGRPERWANVGTVLHQRPLVVAACRRHL